MKIEFQADEATIGTGEHYGSGMITVTVEASGRSVASALDVDDRLFDLDMRDIIDEAGATKLLDAFTPEELTVWVSESYSDSYIDLLNAVGLEAIHEYLSHVE